MALHAGTAYPLALSLPMSTVADFFSSQAFGRHMKDREQKQKATVALFGRLDSISRQINGLARIMAGRR